MPKGLWNRNRLVLRVGVQGALREGNTEDWSKYASRSFAELQVGVEWHFGILGERHPLDR